MNHFINGNNSNALKAVLFLNGKNNYYLYNIDFASALKIVSIDFKTDVIKDSSYKIATYPW